MLKGQQVQAIEFLNSWLANKTQKVAALQGWAGTGKTWLCGYWLEEVLAANPGKNIQVLAPTNKALDVLRVKCQHLDQDRVEFATCDSFLGRSIKRDEDGEQIKAQGKGREPAFLTICDEASMVKAEYDSSLRYRAKRLLYVGDPGQLPPINEDLSTAFTNCPVFLMTEVVRFDGDIIRVATYMRNRIETGETFLLNDVRQQCEGDKSVVFTGREKIHDWALNAISKGLEQRIVAFTNADVDAHNNFMHRALFPNAELFGVGEKIIVNETYELNSDEMLYNGEMLTVVDCVRGEDLSGVVNYAVTFTRDNVPAMMIDGVPAPSQLTLNVAADAVKKQLTSEIWRLRAVQGAFNEVQALVAARRPLNKLAPLRHSYASTVHKSQGSTYDVCFVDWASIYRSKDRARMMYVGFTRPSKFLVVCYK